MGVWYDEVWYCTVKYGMRQDKMKYDMKCGMVWFDMVLYGVVWRGTSRYKMR